MNWYKGMLGFKCNIKLRFLSVLIYEECSLGTRFLKMGSIDADRAGSLFSVLALSF
jgi:hypothetical protein